MTVRATAWLWIAFATAIANAESGSFLLTDVDGRRIEAKSITLKSDGTLSLVPPAVNGPMRVDDLAEIIPRRTRTSVADRAPAAGQDFMLADGGRLSGRIVEESGSPRGVVAEIVGLGRTALAFEGVAAIRTRPQLYDIGERELAARLNPRDASRDFLIAVAGSQATALPGALERLTAGEWTFRFSQRARTGKLDQAYAVVLAGGANVVAAGPARVFLRSGGDFSGALLAADDDGLRINPSFGTESRLAWSQIERIAIHSARVEFVSDLKPAHADSHGYFGYRWPWRADRSLSGGVLRIGRTTFAKGLAVHSFSRMEYDLTDAFKQFRTVIGLDDARSDRGESGPASGGRAVFRVYGDGKTLFDSGPVRTGDAPREILVVLVGVKRLALEVDFGTGLDVGDRAVWGNARLIR